MTPKQARNQERRYTETELRALKRAVIIERAARKIYERKLREVLEPTDYDDIRRICQVESLARCETKSLASAIAKAGDA